MKLLVKKTNSVDEIIIKNFKNENLGDIANKFATNFNENVQKIIHPCDIKTIKCDHNRIQNSMFLSHADEDELYNILKNLNIKKALELI